MGFLKSIGPSLFKRNSAWRTLSALNQLASTSSAPAQHHSVHHKPNIRRYATDQGLLRLPVPALKQTMDKFLLSARVICNDDEFKTAEKLVADILRPGGDGQKLQTILEQRAKTEVNWLSDWWLDAAYLENRIPCPLYVNPGVRYEMQDFKNTKDQVRGAAKLVQGVLDYKVKIDSNTLPEEFIGKDPLCMSQFYSILSTCRIPGLPKDSIVNFPGGKPDSPRHIVVAHNYQFFKLDVYGSDGHVLSQSQLEEQLGKVIAASPTPGPQVGILTTDTRDNWAKTYQILMKDQQNKASAEQIQNAIFVLCLDKESRPVANEAELRSRTLSIVNNGLGSKWNSGNRWFDKTVQFIVGADGTVGINYEHAPAEGPPILSLLDHTFDVFKKGGLEVAEASGVSEPEALPFNVSEDIQGAIGSASKAFDVLCEDMNPSEIQFEEFGKNFPKSVKMSPDAFIQLALQLAYYRLHGHHTATYESGSLRRFALGRTDTIRSSSITSAAFCSAMENPNVSDSERAEKMREAALAHRTYAAEVMNGNGIDRHLLGLKRAANINSIQVPELLTSPIYDKMFYWALSTSQVPSRHDTLPSFTPAVPNGYAICYNPMETLINLYIATWNSNKETSSADMANSFFQALIDGKRILSKS